MADMQKQIGNAQEGAEEKSANLIMGSLHGLDETAAHIKNIYEAMMFIHQRKI